MEKERNSQKIRVLDRKTTSLEPDYVEFLPSDFGIKAYTTFYSLNSETQVVSGGLTIYSIPVENQESSSKATLLNPTFQEAMPGVFDSVLSNSLPGSENVEITLALVSGNLEKYLIDLREGRAKRLRGFDLSENGKNKCVYVDESDKKSFLAAGLESGSIGVCHEDTGSVYFLNGHEFTCWATCFLKESEGENVLISGGDDMKLILHDLREGSETGSKVVNQK